MSKTKTKTNKTITLGLAISLAMLLLMVNVKISSAQITLTASDIPSPGLYALEAVDTASTVTIGGTGAQTWNYTGINQTRVDTFQFSNPAAAPGHTFFPSSTLCFTISTQLPGGIIYMKTDANAYATQGLYFLNGLPVIYSSPEMFIKLPSSTGNTAANGQFKYQFKVPSTQSGVDSVWIKHTDTYNWLCDAWGNLTTQLGTFNCLRIKWYDATIDSTSIKGTATGGVWAPAGPPALDTVIHYRYWHNTFKFPAVEIDAKPNGHIIEARRALAIPVVTGINEMSNYTLENTSAYPNPASAEINIVGTNMNDFESIRVFDCLGREINNLKINGNSVKLNTSEYAPGIYIYKVCGKSNNLISTGRFCVSK